MREKIREKCPWLDEVVVVHTSLSQDVGYHGAELLLSMIRKIARREKEVHVGVAGGHAMRRLTRSLAMLLRQPALELPVTIVFHALVAGFDVDDPRTDPSAFFAFLFEDAAMEATTRFVGLGASAFVEWKDCPAMRENLVVREAVVAAGKLDIIVTSCSCWEDQHSLLRHYMDKWDKDSADVLRSTGCVGDVLWRPVGKDGPITERTHTRAFTLLELDELPGRIGEGLQVLLVAGPCGGCGRPKTEILQAVLNTERPLITHLVVDTRTSRGLFGRR
jgi:DNA-binding transcriptional regulator LsrR (DeoR family)